VSHARLQTNLEIVAEANDQFHWGTRIDEVEDAARKLRERHLCPVLLGELEA